MALSAEQQAELDALNAEEAQLTAQQSAPATMSTTTLPASGMTFKPSLTTASLPPEHKAEWDALNAEEAQLTAQQPANVGASLPAYSEAGFAPIASTPAQSSGAVQSTSPRPEDWLSSFWERVSPSKREKDGGVINDDLEKLPDWTLMPELRSHLNSPVAVLGSLISGPEETKKVIEKQFPGVKIEKKGSYLEITSKDDGHKYAWKPGWRWSDTARAALTVPVAAGGGAAALAALPFEIPAAGLAGTLAGAGALEGYKYAAGGGFSPGNVVAAGVLHGAGALAGKGLQTVGNVLGGAAPEAGAAAAQMTPQQIGETMVAASRGDIGAAADFAGQVRPDPNVLAAAGRTGVLPALDVAHASTNPAMQEVAQAVEGAAGRHAKVSAGLAQNLDRALTAAGAQANSGAVDTTAKEAIKGALDAAKDLTNSLHQEVYGDRGAGGLVPANTPTPLNNFNAYLEKMSANENGTLPKLVEKVRDDLLRGTTTGPRPKVLSSGAVLDEYGIPRRMTADEMIAARAPQHPTLATVERIRRDIGAASAGKSSPYKKLGQDVAHGLYDALESDKQAVAEQAGVGVREKALAAKAASIAQRDLERRAVEVLGKNGERALAGQLNSAVRSLPNMAPDGFERIMQFTPEGLRSPVARSSLFQFINDGQLDVREFTKWYKSLQGNAKSFNALKTNIGEDMASALHDTYTVAQAVDGAMSKNAPHFATTFPDKVTLPILAKNLFKVTVTSNIPGPEILKYYMLDRIFSAGTPLKDALQSFITSPAGRAAMEVSAKGPASEGFVRNLMNSGPARRLLDAMRVPTSERLRWWQNAFTSTAVGSPLRAAMTPQPTMEAQ